MKKKTKVAFLGPLGTYSHLAAEKSFGSAMVAFPCATIDEVFSFVEKKPTFLGIVPIENSTEGGVHETLTRLASTSLNICGELFLEINHSLLSKAPSLNQIRKVYSHPQALAQCAKWLKKNIKNAQLIKVNSTAEAASLARKNKNSAAISSPTSADIFQLAVLRKNIQDHSANATRFILIGKQNPPSTGADKTTLIFSTGDEAGSLVNALLVLKKHKVNMTRIESAPNREVMWEYLFFTEVLGHTQDLNLARALKDLKKHCSLIKILGSYPSNNK